MAKNIGFDLDDVLLNFSDTLRIHYNNRFEKNFEREDMTTFYLEEVWGISVEEVHKILDDFYYHDDHINSLPIEGAVEAVKKLAENNDLYIITAKPDSLEQKTLEWVEKYFAGAFKNIHFANHTDKERKCKKSEICKELKIDIFVDDSLHNAEDVAGVGIPVLLPDTPWNQTDKLPPLVTRVYSWEEII